MESLRTWSWGFFFAPAFGPGCVRRPPMIVVMKLGSSQKQVEHVIQLVREMGLKEHVIVGTERTVVACIGNDRFNDRSALESVEGVEKVVPILAPYKIASSEVKKERTT